MWEFYVGLLSSEVVHKNVLSSSSVFADRSFSFLLAVSFYCFFHSFFRPLFFFNLTSLF